MALVNYDYDSSDQDDEEELSSSCIIVNKSNSTENKPAKNNDQGQKKETIDNENKESSSIGKLLSVLPKTKPTLQPTTINEDQIEDFIPKYQPIPKEKKKEKVKITIPSLSDFKEEEENEPKRIKVSSQNSGLLSLLPPVKGSPLTNKSFVPKTVSQKPKSSTNSSLVPHAVRKKAELSKKASLKKVLKEALANDLESDDDDDIELPETFDEEMWQKVCGRPKKQNQQIIDEPDQVELPTQSINSAPEPVKPYEGLDNAAFKELVGKSKKPQNIKLIDINEEDVVPDADVWITRALTDPEQAAKPVIDNPVDPTRKRKHHITYLAEQAKANEQDFKNQWAASKNNRNQTRAKYGF